MSIKKYSNPDQRSVRHHKEVFDFISDCKIEHNAVYFMGASVIWALVGKTKILPDEKIEKYSPFFENEENPIFSDDSLLKLCEFIQEKAEKAIADKRSKQAALTAEPLIRVWDKGSLKYVEIPESQFNSMFHKRP